MASLHTLPLRLPEELFLRLREWSRRENCSINKVVVEGVQLKLNGGKSLSTDSAFRVRSEEFSLIAMQKVLDGQLEGVIMFGSVARDEDHKESDVDLLFVVSAKVEITRSLYRSLEELLPKSSRFSVQISHGPQLSTAESSLSSLWMEIALDGVVLWQNESRLTAMLSKLRRKMFSQGPSRKVAYGQPYWVVK